jgi:putative intracellular protease/amidase
MRRLFLTTTLLAYIAVAGHPQPVLAAPAAAAVSQAALRLPVPKDHRARPLVAIVAANAGAETTDFVIPYAILKDAGVADVVSLSTRPGPVQLRTALRIVADSTIAQFDSSQPSGADIVIVPAQVDPKDEALNAWLRRQAQRGATIVSICEGARVLAHAGLLDGRRAATHWHALPDLEKHYPHTTWVRDRRYLQDGPIISTTGVSASIPASLALVEAIGGHASAQAVAQRIGFASWGPAHRTADFAYSRGDLAHAVGAMASFWSRQKAEFPIAPGVDDFGLALQADAWSRTFRVKAVTTSATAEIRSSHGMTILADGRPGSGDFVAFAPGPRPLETAFAQIERRYGPASLRFVKVSLEYDDPRRPSAGR